MKNNFLFYLVTAEMDGRHAFDSATDDEIIKALKDKEGNKVLRTNHDVEYEADLFNDWDDYVEDWLKEECGEYIKGTDIDEKFVKDHWCIAVNDNVANALADLNKC